MLNKFSGAEPRVFRVTRAPQRHFFFPFFDKFEWTPIKYFYDEFDFRQKKGTIVMETFDWRSPKNLVSKNEKKSLRGGCDW